MCTLYALEMCKSIQKFARLIIGAEGFEKFVMYHGKEKSQALLRLWVMPAVILSTVLFCFRLCIK